MPVHTQECQAAGKTVCPRGFRKFDTLLHRNRGIVNAVNQNQGSSQATDVKRRRQRIEPAVESLRAGPETKAEILGTGGKENLKQRLRIGREIFMRTAAVFGKFPKRMTSSNKNPFQICNRAFGTGNEVLQCFSNVVLSAESDGKPDTLTYLRIRCRNQGRATSITEARNGRITPDGMKNGFDVPGLLWTKVLFFHLGEIRNIHGETGLRQRFGNADQIQAIFARWVHTMHDEQRRVRV